MIIKNITDLYQLFILFPAFLSHFPKPYALMKRTSDSKLATVSHKTNILSRLSVELSNSFMKYAQQSFLKLTY